MSGGSLAGLCQTPFEGVSLGDERLVVVEGILTVGIGVKIQDGIYDGKIQRLQTAEQGLAGSAVSRALIVITAKAGGIGLRAGGLAHSAVGLPRGSVNHGSILLWRRFAP